MSGYTIGEIVVWLLLAAILGFILGWLLRTRKCESEHGAADRPASTAAPAAPSTASSTHATLVGGTTKKSPDKTAAKKSPAKTAAKKSPAKTAAKKSPAKTAAKKAPARKTVATGRFAGSGKPLSGGRAPSAEYKIKGNEDSMIYHTPESPSYGRTIAETWFKTEAAAVAAGFRKPKNA